MILYIADLHFGHTNILRHDHRPFKDAEEMDAFLIHMWNERVHNDDTVYILGDVCYSKSPEYYLRQLKGHKHLIIGNHDKKLLKNKKAMSYFESVSYMRTIEDQGRKVVLCHYPIAEWDGYFRGVYHIYGHIHNNDNEAKFFMESKERAFNAGCMLTGYAPVSLGELIRMKEHSQKES